MTAEGLEVEGLVVRFGGHVAVDDVAFEAPPGRITGLIGPNGAGKTTTFNACTGLLRPDAGSVRLDGVDVTGLPPPKRARLGLGRTFQRMELFDRLTVSENIALGREARLTGARRLGPLFATRTELAAVATARDEAIERCGLGAIAMRPAGSLSTGQRRLVELARALAGGFSVVLLDEPSSGLDPRETEAFGTVLCQAARERRTAILLVEHDMALVTPVCDYVYVLDFGRLIIDGETAEVLASGVVRAAYLGDEVPV